MGSCLDRTVGALVGLACGDAVGTTLEFAPPGTFEPIDDMVGGGPFDTTAAIAGGLAGARWGLAAPAAAPATASTSSSRPACAPSSTSRPTTTASPPTPTSSTRRRAVGRSTSATSASRYPDLSVVDDHRDDEVLALIGDARAGGAVYVHGWDATR